MAKLHLTIAVGIILTLCLAPTLVSAQGRSNTDWLEFREIYPYHIQGVALSGPRADGSRTVIIAEPPPHVTLDALKSKVDAAVFAGAHVESQNIGAGGWARDVVASLPKKTDSELHSFIDKLHIYLFETAYKAYPLPFTRSNPDKSPLDLAVSASDLNKWLYQANEKFQPLFGGKSAAISELLRTGQSGLYFSDTPGLVSLILPKKLSLSQFKRELRQFALDSDLILGAVDSPTHTAIVARERHVSVEALPPLRVETMLQLAATKKSELAQSYERNNFFAGRTDLLQFDWAPIYLSDELIDTEYGSLLNITDQLLKSWSSAGLVSYVDFDYPHPSKYPFDQALIIDAGLSRVTFNWNTKGAGYVVDFGARKILAVNRTGALPVSYFPGDDNKPGNPLEKYEKQGYQWFAERSDPNLVRVVQYATLYQIFREFGITDDSIRANAYSRPELKVLSDSAREFLDDFLKRDLGALVPKSPTPQMKSEIDKTLGGIQDLQKRLRAELTVFSRTFLNDVSDRLANPRIDEPLLDSIRRGRVNELTLTGEQDKNLRARKIALEIASNPFIKEWAHHFLDIEDIVLRYDEASQKRDSGWIRTASIVLSQTEGAIAKLVGGHNLDSRILHFRVSATVAPGDIKILNEAGKTVILHNASDTSRLPAILRDSALTADGNLQARLPALLKEAPRTASLSREEALNFRPALGRKDRGMQPLAESAGGGGGRSFTNWPRIAAAAGEDRSGIGVLPVTDRSLVIRKNADLTFDATMPTRRTLYADSYEGIIDLVQSVMKKPDTAAGNWQIHFVGFSREEASNFIKTAETKFAASERLELAGFVGSGNVNSGKLEEALSRRFDFSQARVLEPETVPTVGALKGEAIQVSYVIPAVQNAQPSLKLKVTVTLAEGSKAGTAQELETGVRSALGKLAPKTPVASRNAVSEKILNGLKQDLQKIHLEGTRIEAVEIEVGTDFGDVYILD
jgi:hypothetical protein